MDAPEVAITFIVRVTRSPSGELTGVVERVRTGAKQRFQGREALGRVIDDALSARGAGRRGKEEEARCEGARAPARQEE